jgi:4-alpha-glucanotransferase
MHHIQLIFGTYNSQPVGNFHDTIEHVYQNAYKPFISVLNKYPEFPVTLYYSGYLLEWMENNHPEFLMLLDEMVKRKQVELLGGGYYEPIFTTIPHTSILGQAECLTTYLRVHFGKRPRGCWLPERAWDPGLISLLKGAGFEYTFLDENYFRHAGADDDSLFYPCLTEDQGKALKVFPLARQIRQSIPDSTPEEVIEQLWKVSSRDKDRLVMLFDDGAKMGDWSNSHKLYYKDGWLEKFIKAVIENQDWIHPVHPGRYGRERPETGKFYFPAMLNEDMNAWLNTTLMGEDRQGRKPRPVSRSFKDYYRKYGESMFLYSKMMYVKLLTNQIKGDKYKKKAAREELWKGQCNSAYWHGLFGGIYYNHLRKETYRSLIESEKLTRDKSVFFPSIIAFDFDTDGSDEYLFQGVDMNVYVHLKGGMLFELDYLPVSWNYLDTLSRYDEPYLAEEKKDGFPVDAYLRKAFVDHFLDRKARLSSIKEGIVRSQANLGECVYRVMEFNREKNEIILECEENLERDGAAFPVRIEKNYRFKRKALVVRYKITNASSSPLESVFCPEINLALASNQSEAQTILGQREKESVEIPVEPQETAGLDSILVNDLQNSVQVRITPDKPFSLWSFPVFTHSRTFETIDCIYQSTCFMPRWELKLEPEESFEVEIEMALSEIK